MRLHNSYTLNSKKRSSKRISITVVTGLWIIICLLVIDFAVNFLFPYPSDPRITSSGQIDRYFNYGRSIEGKLSQMLGSTDESSSAIAQAGWLDPDLWKKLNLPTHPANSKNLLVAVYGMSFSNQVAEAMKEIDPKITLRMIAAPAAPLNYSFAAYNKDRGRHNADIVMLGVLASSVKGLRTMNGMTWQFEGPAPYTYPKYFLEDGKLKEISPTITSLAELRAAFNNKQQWDAYTTQLRHYDEFFNSFLFSGFLDNSAIVRLIRRAWAQRHQKTIEDKIHSVNGFNTEVDIPVLKAIVTEFATSAKQDGKMPIVLLLNDKGYSDNLFRALEPTLTSASIPYVSTHNIAPASNLSNFIGDGHFVHSANKEIAKAVLKLVNN
jgi:hypothetical protein